MIIKSVDYQKRIEQINQVFELSVIKNDKKKCLSLRNIRSGLYAEKDMAYKLDIAFGNHKDVIVLNDIKIEFNGLTAQIDHLVLTCYSAYFIETKNSWGNISINEYRDWARYFGKTRYNMDSPVRQSEDHQKVLFELLKANLEKFMGKAFPGIYKKLGTYTAHHYIAIGKEATISGKGREQVKEQLLKYDQVTNKILEHYKTSSKKYLIADLKDNDKFKTLNPKELQNMGEFIFSCDISGDDPLKAFNIDIEIKAENNYPLANEEIEKTSINEKAVEYSIHAPSDVCTECNSNLEIVWGNKYKNYYWHCENCNKNQSIKVKCPSCNTGMRLKKDRNNYNIYCTKCEIDGFYYSSK